LSTRNQSALNKPESPAVVASGGILIGKNFFRAFQATSPFGKIELYDKNLVLSIQFIPRFILRFFRWAGNIRFMIGTYKNFPDRIVLNYPELTGYTQTSYSSFSGCAIRLFHNNPAYPPFLYFRAKSQDASAIINYLKNHNVPYKTK
jgi:hypothetical protein